MGAQCVDEPRARMWQAGSYWLEIGFAQLLEHRHAERNGCSGHDTERDRGAGGVPRFEEEAHGERNTAGYSRCDERAELNAKIAMPVAEVMQDLQTPDSHREPGGFDVTLRDRDAQGCEDWDVALKVAERSSVAVVPSVLVGYRRRRESMSTRTDRMWRSYALVMNGARQRRPTLSPSVLKKGRQAKDFVLASSERANLTGMRRPMSTRRTFDEHMTAAYRVGQ